MQKKKFNKFSFCAHHFQLFDAFERFIQIAIKKNRSHNLPKASHSGHCGDESEIDIQIFNYVKLHFCFIFYDRGFSEI